MKFRSYILILAEHAVYILKGTVCSLGKEEVDDRDKREIEDGPNDVEFPLETLDADRGNLDDFVF